MHLKAAIIKYTGEALDPVIPKEIDGFPVTRIKEGAFCDRTE